MGKKMDLAMVAWVALAWKGLDLAWEDPDTGWGDQAMVVMEWEALDTVETG